MTARVHHGSASDCPLVGSSDDSLFFSSVDPWVKKMG